MKRNILISFLLSLPLMGQMLTMQQCVEQTLSNHPDIKIFMLKVAQSEKSYEASRANYFPQMTLIGEYDPFRTYVMPQNGQFQTIDNDGWSAGAIVQQKVWDFSKTTSLVKAEQNEQKIAELSFNDAKAAMVYKVQSLYALMVVQREAVVVRRKDMEAKQALYAQANALVVQGLRTEADASRFLAAYFLAKDNLGIAQASLDKTRTTMALYIDAPIPEDVELESDVIKHGIPRIESNPILQDAMLANNLQIKIASQSIDKNKLQYRAAQASHYGSIDAFASYTYQDTLNRYDTSSVGVLLTIPLYSGGRIGAEAQRARIGIDVAREQRSSRIIALREELNALLIDLKRYEKSIEAKQAQLNSAEATRKVLEARYKEGLSTYIEVLDATALYLNAELGLLEALYGRKVAVNNLEYLIGKEE
ncbi:TolC family protein [Sulfurovum sp.]|uniref:TolC family protein n=1 Tax=Sulfurovum sp. TaxID=1969726 RepID=UPI003569ACA9